MAGENDSTTFVPIPPQVAAKFPDLVGNMPPGFVAPTFVGEPLPAEPAPTGAGDPGGYGAPPPPEVFPVPPRDDTIVGAGAISEDLFAPVDTAQQRLDNFSEALDWLKRGNRIARAGWNGQYLEIEHGRVLYHDGGAREIYATLSDDLLATDWRIVS